MNRAILLIRNDPAWSIVPTLAVLAIILELWTSFSSSHFGTTATYFVVPMVLVLVMGQSQNSLLFLSGLPIDGREIVRSRVLILLFCAWIPFAVRLTGYALGNHTGAAGLRESLSIGLFGTAFALFVQTIWLPVARVPQAAVWAFWIAAMTVSGFLRATSSLEVVWTVNGLFALIAVALYIFRWPRQAFSFQSAPLKASSSVHVRQTMNGSRSAAGFAAPLRAVFRKYALLFLAFAAFYPLLDNVALTLCFIPGYMQHALFGIPWLGTMPMRRRTIGAMIVVPYLVLLCAGVAVDMKYGIGSRPKESVELTFINGDASLQSGRAWWKWTLGEAPEIQAPWGEVHKPVSARAVLFTIYDPWGFTASSSREFRDWQSRRVSREIYGVEVPLERIGELPRMTPLLHRAPMQILTIELLVAIVLAAFSLGVVPYWRRLRGLPFKVVRGLSWVVLLPLVCGLAFASLVLGLSFPSVILDTLVIAITGALVTPALFYTVPAVIVLALFWLTLTVFDELDYALLPVQRQAAGI
jgi:hypothetical protein